MQASIGEAGGVALLIRMATQFPQSASVQADVSGAIAVLAVDDALEAAIAQGGGIEVLLGALQRHRATASVAAHAWHALTNLSVSVDNKSRMASGTDIKGLVAATLETHAGAPRVIEGVATTLRNLCLGTGAAPFVDGKTLGLLVHELQVHAQQPSLTAGPIAQPNRLLVRS